MEEETISAVPSWKAKQLLILAGMDASSDSPTSDDLRKAQELLRQMDMGASSDDLDNAYRILSEQVAKSEIGSSGVSADEARAQNLIRQLTAKLEQVVTDGRLLWEGDLRLPADFVTYLEAALQREFKGQTLTIGAFELCFEHLCGSQSFDCQTLHLNSAHGALLELATYHGGGDDVDVLCLEWRPSMPARFVCFEMWDDETLGIDDDDDVDERRTPVEYVFSERIDDWDERLSPGDELRDRIEYNLEHFRGQDFGWSLNTAALMAGERELCMNYHTVRQHIFEAFQDVLDTLGESWL